MQLPSGPLLVSMPKGKITLERLTGAGRRYGPELLHMTDPSHNSYARTNHMVSKSTTLENNPTVPWHVVEMKNLEKTLLGSTMNAGNNFPRRRKIEVHLQKI